MVSRKSAALTSMAFAGRHGSLKTSFRCRRIRKHRLGYRAQTVRLRHHRPGIRVTGAGEGPTREAAASARDRYRAAGRRMSRCTVTKGKEARIAAARQ